MIYFLNEKSTSFSFITIFINDTAYVTNLIYKFFQFFFDEKKEKYNLHPQTDYLIKKHLLLFNYFF